MRQRRADTSADQARFIDLQIQIATGEFEGRPWAELADIDREAAKIARNQPWAPSLPCVRKHEFFAGRVERVTVAPVDFLKHGRTLLNQYACIRHLDLPRGSKIPEGFFQHELMDELMSIVADNCEVSDADLEDIRGRQLFWLSLVNSHVTKRGLNHLAALAALRYVNLAGSPVDPLDPATTDGSDAISAVQPERLRKLELEVLKHSKRTGKIAWFHRDGWPAIDHPPNRFLMRYYYSPAR